MESKHLVQQTQSCLHQLVRSTLPDEEWREIYRCIRCGCAFKVEKVS